MPLTAAATAAALGLPGIAGTLAPQWDEAMADMPADPAAALCAYDLPVLRAVLGLAPDTDAVIAAAAAALASDADLARLGWYLHWRIYRAPLLGPAWGLTDLPGPRAAISGGFFLLLALPLAQALPELHRRRGYDPAITADTLREAACFDANHRAATGRPGIFASQFPFFRCYLADEPLVRLGRLEFQFRPWRGGATVWRRADGAVMALAEAGTQVAADGLRAATGWEATLAVDAAAAVGHPITPDGRILPQRVRLPRPAWSPCLASGDPIADVHIPAGGRMDWAACADAFRRAVAFADRHLRVRPRAAVCQTWFLDPRLAELLPADANPLHFQRAVHLFPTAPDPGSLWFVFLRPTPAGTDPATLPQDTSLRRALAGFLADGKTWHGGGMFALWDDLSALHDGFYRERWAATLAALAV